MFACGYPPRSWQAAYSLPIHVFVSRKKGFTTLYCKYCRSLESGLLQLTPADLAKFMAAVSSTAGSQAMPRSLYGPGALRSMVSLCYPEYLAVPSVGLLTWLLLLWLVQRQPHTSLHPPNLLPQQLWLGSRGRVLNGKVKSDPSFLTAVTFHI